jgi:nitroimidazol reductase NimA-like FMN-containing flavoprotein (pyridoxamine 5'-phosphate oxidase superfamily)
MPDIQRPDMADYGVPEELDGALDWSWALEHLEKSRNFWVVTVDPGGRPHAMPVWGVWFDDRFWFSAAPTALKVRNIEANPHVVVTGEDTVNVVSIEGTARLVEGRQDAAEAWARRYESDPEKQRELAAFMIGGTVFEVTPHKAFGMIESPERFSSSATRWVW